MSSPLPRLHAAATAVPAVAAEAEGESSTHGCLCACLAAVRAPYVAATWEFLLLPLACTGYGRKRERERGREKGDLAMPQRCAAALRLVRFVEVTALHGPDAPSPGEIICNEKVVAR